MFHLNHPYVTICNITVPIVKLSSKLTKTQPAQGIPRLIIVEDSLQAMKCSSVWAECLSLLTWEDDNNEDIMPVDLSAGIIEKILEFGEQYKVRYFQYNAFMISCKTLAINVSNFG